MKQHAAYAFIVELMFKELVCFSGVVKVIIMVPLRSSPWTALLAAGSLHSECSDSSHLLMSYASSTLPGKSSRNHTCTAPRQRAILDQQIKMEQGQKEIFQKRNTFRYPETSGEYCIVCTLAHCMWLQPSFF